MANPITLRDEAIAGPNFRPGFVGEKERGRAHDVGSHYGFPTILGAECEKLESLVANNSWMNGR